MRKGWPQPGGGTCPLALPFFLPTPACCPPPVLPLPPPSLTRCAATTSAWRWTTSAPAWHTWVRGCACWTPSPRWGQRVAVEWVRPALGWGCTWHRASLLRAGCACSMAEGKLADDISLMCQNMLRAASAIPLSDRRPRPARGVCTPQGPVRRADRAGGGAASVAAHAAAAATAAGHGATGAPGHGGGGVTAATRTAGGPRCQTDALYTVPRVDPSLLPARSACGVLRCNAQHM